jgi:integrase
MSVRKRNWTSGGVEREAWVCDYVDLEGKRRLKTFIKKKDAVAYAATVSVDLRSGIHVADTASQTVFEAGEVWIADAERVGLERTSVDQYRQHLNFHIKPFIGNTLLTKLNVPLVKKFEDKLRDEKRSGAMVRRVVSSLGSLIANAHDHGAIARNPVRERTRQRKAGKDRRAERRKNGKLKISVDIPAPAEIKAIVHSAAGRWRPVLITAIFTGLRASELRGLRWADVDFTHREVQVRQRADRFNVLGRPKSDAGERTVPLPPLALNTLREWKLRCPKGELDLVFPNGKGKIESHANIINRGLIPVQLAAGVIVKTDKRDEEGKPICAAKYTGLHALRHFYASWCINRRADGGLELPLKVVQERLGHSSITLTADRYGHLFPRGDDAAEFEAAENALLA